MLNHHGSGGLGILLRMEDLHESEKLLISRDFFELASISGEDHDPYDTYAKILIKWGIMCPHPEEKVTFSGRNYNCNCCGSILSSDPIGKIRLESIAK